MVGVATTEWLSLYFPPGDPLNREDVELIFEYNATTDTAESEAAVTTVGQPADIQDTTFYQSTSDSFS